MFCRRQLEKIWWTWSSAETMRIRLGSFSLYLLIFLCYALDFLSSRGEIRRAYHKLSLQYHPDKVGDKSDDEKAGMFRCLLFLASDFSSSAAHAIFLKVSSAYEVLANEKSRQGYDIWVKGGRKRRPKPGDLGGSMSCP
eukprot:766985-Hanusia_phi.AAC.2